VNPRKQAVIVALAGLLLVAALITALVWALMLEQQRRKPSGSGNPRAEPTGELRIYGGLPNASNYGHPVIVLTNAAYLSGYCEARRNPAWVAFSVGSISIGSTAKRPSKFTTDTRTRSATHDDYTGSGFDRGHMAPNYAIGTRYGHEAQRETFLMSNISPQAPDLNRRQGQMVGTRWSPQNRLSPSFSRLAAFRDDHFKGWNAHKDTTAGVVYTEITALRNGTHGIEDMPTVVAKLLAWA